MDAFRAVRQRPVGSISCRTRDARAVLAGPALVAMVLGTAAGQAAAQEVVIDFDSGAPLSSYAAQGVSFSPNVVLWGPFGCSTLDNADCGPVSVPYGICAGFCGGQGAGVITFNPPVQRVSIYVLSGPGADRLNPGSTLTAYDTRGGVIAQDEADDRVQFDALEVFSPCKAIGRVEINSMFVGSEAWDHLTFERLTPAECCLPDMAPAGSPDGFLDTTDVVAFINAFNAVDARADVWPFNGDGLLNVNDIVTFIQAFWTGCE